jgi:hypothetical protein
MAGFESLREFQPVPSVRSAPGELADEGQLLLLTLESICTQRALDEADLVRRLKGWFRSHPKDMTPLVRHVLSRFQAGESPAEASEGASFDPEFSPPDGGHLTRCLPVALYRVMDAARRQADMVAVARLTHWDAVWLYRPHSYWGRLWCSLSRVNPSHLKPVCQVTCCRRCGRLWCRLLTRHNWMFPAALWGRWGLACGR